MKTEDEIAAEEAEVKRVQDVSDEATAKLKEQDDAKIKEEADRVARGDSAEVDDGDKAGKGADDTAGDSAKVGDKDADTKASQKSTMVPKGRLDTKNRMLDDANKTIQDLEAKLKSSGVDATAGEDKKDDSIDIQIQTAEDAYVAARKDGDADAEMKAMREIRTLERDQRLSENDTLKNSAVSEAAEDVKFNNVMDVVESDHPEIDPANYDPDDPKSVYNQDVVDEVVDLQHGFMLRGYSKSEAVIRAVGYVFPSIGGTDEVSEARDKKTAERKAAATDKNLKAAGKTAPDTGGVGKEGGTAGATDTMPDGAKLSEEEFDALPEAMKQRMRGDEVG